MYVLHSYALHFWLAFDSTKSTWTIVMNNTWIRFVWYIGHHGIGVITPFTFMALCFNNILANVATNANIMFIAKLKSAIFSYNWRIWWFIVINIVTCIHIWMCLSWLFVFFFLALWSYTCILWNEMNAGNIKLNILIIPKLVLGVAKNYYCHYCNYFSDYDFR